MDYNNAVTNYTISANTTYTATKDCIVTSESPINKSNRIIVNGKDYSPCSFGTGLCTLDTASEKYWVNYKIILKNGDTIKAPSDTGLRITITPFFD